MTEQTVLSILRGYWQDMMPVTGEEFEREWRETLDEFTLPEIAQEIIAAWYEGAFTGQSGGCPTGNTGDFLNAVINGEIE